MRNEGLLYRRKFKQNRQSQAEGKTTPRKASSKKPLLQWSSIFKISLAQGERSCREKIWSFLLEALQYGAI